MNIVFVSLTIIVILASILLTIVVLLQNGKGGGLASNFAAGNQTFGVRQTADILEKITWILCVVVFVGSILSAFTTGKSGESAVDITDKIENVAGEQAPEFPAAPVQQDAPSQEAPAEGEN